MSRTKGRVVRMLGRLVLADSEIIEVRDLDGSFRLLSARAQPAQARAYQPGDKVQVWLPGDHMRTYTPIGWAADGRTELLVFLRQGSVASAWARGLRVSSPLRFVGPQRSLSLPPGQMALVGDETSIAVAAAYARARPGSVRTLLRVRPETELDETLSALDLDATVLRDDASLEAAVRTIPSGVAVGITGGGTLIQRVRAQLRERGVRPRVKAYWVEGRAGLD